MNQNNICLLRYERQSIANGILTLRTSLHHTPRSQPFDTPEDVFHRLYFISADNDDEFTDIGYLRERKQSSKEHWLASERQKDLIQSDMHAVCLPRSRKNHTNHYDGILPKQISSSRFGKDHPPCGGLKCRGHLYGNDLVHAAKPSINNDHSSII